MINAGTSKCPALFRADDNVANVIFHNKKSDF